MSLILQFFCFCFLLFFFTIGFMAQRYTIVLQQNENFSIKRALRCEGLSLDVEIKQYYRKTDKTVVTVNLIVFTVIRVTKWHYIFVSLFAFRSIVDQGFLNGSSKHAILENNTMALETKMADGKLCVHISYRSHLCFPVVFYKS